MACEYTCDGCGKKASGVFWPHGAPGWQKPSAWFQRQDEDGPQDACSRACIEAIAERTKKTSAVLPVW